MDCLEGNPHPESKTEVLTGSRIRTVTLGEDAPSYRTHSPVLDYRNLDKGREK
jgi:hypothetical protein